MLSKRLRSLFKSFDLLVIQAFLAAWRTACDSAGVVTFLIPKGTYLVGPVKFSGPCKNVSSLTVKMKARF